MTDPLRSVLDRAAPEPPVSVDLAAVLRGAIRRRARARRRLVVGASGAVAAVAALAVVLATLLPRPSAAPPAGQHQNGTSEPPHTADNRTRTTAALDRILAQLPVYPGSRVATEANHPYLTGPLGFPAGGVDRGNTRLAHGTVDAARNYLRSHLPAGVRFTGSAGSASSSGSPELPAVESDMWTGPSSWQQPSVFYDLTFGFSYTVDTRGRLEIRTDVQAAPQPASGAGQRIPTQGPLRVEITRDELGGAADPRHRTATVTGKPATRLADDINRLPTTAPDQHHCPADAASTTDTLRFYLAYTNRGPGGPYATAIVVDSECGAFVRIGRGPTLTIDAELLMDLDSAVGR